MEIRLKEDWISPTASFALIFVLPVVTLWFGISGFASNSSILDGYNNKIQIIICVSTVSSILESKTYETGKIQWLVNVAGNFPAKLLKFFSQANNTTTSEG